MKPLHIGLTGPIGAGKSTVASCWKQLGARLVDGDEMGRRAIETDAARKDLISRYGNHIANADGEIIRGQLAKAAFSTPENQLDLTRITFPTLYRFARLEMERLSATTKIVVFDAALIFEWGIESDFDRIVVVTAPNQVLLDNSAKRLGISLEEAAERLARQIPPDDKAMRADHLILNDGTVEELETKARDLWKVLLTFAVSDAMEKQ